MSTTTYLSELLPPLVHEWSRLVLENSDSGLSTDSLASAGSTAYTAGSLGNESTHLQLVTHCSRPQSSEHVVVPPNMVDNYIIQETPSKHIALKQPYISLDNLKKGTLPSLSDFTTLNPTRFTTAAKGKSPLFRTQSTPPGGPYPVINEVDFNYTLIFNYNSSSNMDSTVN